MTDRRITPDGLDRLEAAQRTYADALRRLDRLRRDHTLAAAADAQRGPDEAHRHVKEAFAEW